MGAAKAFKSQFHLSNFKLGHHSASDFYLSCWQKNRAVLPLLCVRGVIFLGCLSILLSSMILTGLGMSFGFWFLYLTHWGLVMITVASGAAFAVSYKAYREGTIEGAFDLPVSAKIFWAAYETAITLAFFITFYYYAFLSFETDLEFAINEVLDVFIHAINSVLMMTLLMTSRVPPRLLHFIYPLCLALIYLVFTVIYHYAGGPYLFDLGFIYPMLDWSNPGPTVGMVAVTAVALILMHWIVVGLAAARDAVTRRYRRDSGDFAVTNIPYN